MKIIFDTNVLISVIIFDKTVEAQFKKILKNNVKVYLSHDIFEELKIKLTTSTKLHKLMLKAQRPITADTVTEFLNLIQDLAILVEPSNKVAICRDLKDNMFLELAEEIQATYIISGDKDLLTLKNYQGTKILKPGELIQELNLE
jgi:uncharacterized protein